jgi:hypothetical protein
MDPKELVVAVDHGNCYWVHGSDACMLSISFWIKLKCGVGGVGGVVDLSK